MGFKGTKEQMLQIKTIENRLGIFRGDYMVRELHKCEFPYLKKLRLHPLIDTIPQTILQSFLKP